jgi:SAM-dependent methyltransferase
VSAAAVATEAAWHDVECGSYVADLPLWRELAAERGGPVLDVGCGTGRVALDLAAAGFAVLGVDAEPALTAEVNRRAAAADLPVRAIAADARGFALDGSAAGAAGRAAGPPFPLAVVPMQVAQLLGGPPGRARMLAAVARQLAPGGLLALALADPFEAVEPGESRPPLPDVLEIDGWVLSSTPVAVRDEGDAVAIDRIRQAVAPDGELTEELATVTLDNCPPATLEDEGRAAGFAVLPARQVPPTPDYVGSTVVMLEAPR